MPFPTGSTLLDDFNRADGGLGANWTTAGGAPVVSSNAFAGGAGANGARWTAASFTLPEVRVTIATVAAFLSVGWLDGSFNGYALTVDSGATSVSLSVITGGSPTTLGAAFSQTISSGDSLGLQRINATTLEVWYRSGAGAWTSLGTRTDGTHTGATNPLISVFDATARLDDFYAGELTTVGALAVTVGAASASATGTLRISGSATGTLGAATLAAVATIAVSGALAGTIGAVSVSAAAALRVTGAASASVGAATVSALGTLRIAGVSALTLGAATLAAAGSSGTDPIITSVTGDPGGLGIVTRGGLATLTGTNL
jgi:hypothetical protein